MGCGGGGVYHEIYETPFFSFLFFWVAVYSHVFFSSLYILYMVFPPPPPDPSLLLMGRNLFFLYV